MPRFTLDRGALEITSPGSQRERASGTLALLIEFVAAALRTPVVSVGSMTFEREELQQGCEPDASFYIQHELHVRDKERIDPRVDPPPDLVIDVDVAHSSLDKFPVFAGLGVPEVWRWKEGQVTVFTLGDDGYRVSERSSALPLLTGDRISRFLAESRSRPCPDWLWAIADWARAAAVLDDSTQ